MIFIPPKKKIKRKVSKSEIEKIIKFEKNIFDTYNKGLIKYPVHLSKGNEKQLSKIFQYVGKMIGFLAHGVIMLMLYCMECLKKNYMTK